MNASILGRMFWKEYRTQRGLWLAIVGFYVLIVACIALFIPPQDSPSFYDLMISGIVMTMFYIFGSAAISYASEREQGTDVWLQTLPLGPTRLLTAKVGWIVLSTLAALAVFGIIATLAAPDSTDRNQPLNDDVAMMFLVLMAVSLTGSLLCDHVLKAIGVTFTIMIAFFVVAISFRIPEVVFSSGIALLAFFGTAIELNRRWLRESSSTWKITLPQGRPLTLDQAIALPAEASSTIRMWRRELKLEAWNACWWLLLLGIGAVAIIFLADVRMASELRALQFGVIVCFVPLMCGAGTCSGEQLRSRYLFQGNRGVSSTMLILAKHAVWVSGGVAVVMLLSWLSWSDILIEPSAAVQSLHGSYNIIPIPRQMLPTSLAQEFGKSSVPGLQLAIAVGMLMYAVGHFCSLVITIPILSLFAALIGGAIAWAGILYCHVLGVPLYVSAIVPAMTFLMLPLIRGGDWIIGNKSKSSWLRFFGWSALAIWTLVSLHAGWRILEISFVNLSVADESPSLGVSYLIWLVAALFAVVAGVWLLDLFRRRVGGRCWLTLPTVALIFLIGHNSIIGIRAVGYAVSISGRAERMQVAFWSVFSEQSETDLARSANDAITSKLPLEEELRRQELEGGPLLQPESFDSARRRVLWQSWDEVLPEQHAWLKENEDALELFRQAVDSEFSGSGVNVIFRDAKPTAVGLGFAHRYGNLIDLVRLKAFEREHAGELDEAWGYHIALVRLFRNALRHSDPPTRLGHMYWLKTMLFDHDLLRWQARQEQTPELLSTAVAQLSGELQYWPSLSDSYRRWGGKLYAEFDHQPLSLRLEDVFVPWERTRARALLTEIIDDYLEILESVEYRDSLISQWSEHGMTTYELPWSVPEEQFILQARSSGRPIARLELRHKSVPGTPYRAEVATETLSHLSQLETSYALARLGRAGDFAFIDENFAVDLLREIEFSQAANNWCLTSAIYSYRAETGKFPETFEEIAQAPETARRMKTALEQSRTRINIHNQRYLQLIAALQGRRTEVPSSVEFDPQYHQFKWPEPEYQIAPKADSENPLTAPRPEVTP